ncbi:unnamed protein product, partial [Dibothriocephalus latus]
MDPLHETPEPTISTGRTEVEEAEDEEEEEEVLREASHEDEEEEEDEAERCAGMEDVDVLNKKPKMVDAVSERRRRRSGGITLVQLHSELHTLISVKASLSCWIVWLDKIVHRCLSSRASGPKRANAARHLMLVWNYYSRASGPKRANAARHLMLVWNYYSSLLMRELTLRFALSFGSCYLLWMLCDEYLSFRLEQVASSPLMTLPVDSHLNDKTTTTTTSTATITSSSYNSMDVFASSASKDSRL